MKIWRRLAAIGLAMVLSLTVPALAVQAGNAAETAAQSAAAAAARYGSAQSLRYALWDGGTVMLTGGTGSYSRTENRALSDDTLYGVGSVSKMYTTAAVMQLAERGRVRLDAPVTTYLPKFTMADARYRKITVRMLLNHSSGLMGSSTSNGFLFGDRDRSATEDLLTRLSTQRLKADPGAYSVYCNDGFTLAELIVEAVSGMSFPEYLKTELLPPLGLSDTLTPEDDFDTARLAKTYADATDTRALPQETLGIVGTGGIYATASDLASFGGALTTASLLRQSSRDAMAASEYRKGMWPKDDLSTFTYGLGWDSVQIFPFSANGIQALAKGGDTYQYHAGLVVIPRYHLACAVLSSGGASTYNELAAEQILIAALKEKGVALDETAPALTAAEPAAMPESLTAYSGTYGSSQQQLDVKIANGTLTLTSLNYANYVLTFRYYDDGTFRSTDGKILLCPVTESNGETYLYQKALTAVPGLGTIPTSNYLAMKLPNNPVSAAVQKTWDAALKESYVPLNEKYTSEEYLMLSTISGMGLDTAPVSIPGYAGSCKIVDETSALYVPQLPELAGRDGADLTLAKKNGVDWLTSGGTICMAVSGVKPIFTDGGWSYSTIQSDGYARWYQTGTAAGKTMRVTVPTHGGFWVYDAKGHLTASSVLWNDAAVTLPKGGLIAFAGDAGARFHLRFTAGK
jgi:CubicO group peptidase (beta-lactamase class C family)